MEDLDYVEAASRLKNQSLALQAGQQTFAQLSGLSLFKYIR
jgi:flagellar hook-associated protein 3 FlgL